jgi:hypothetical protein
MVRARRHDFAILIRQSTDIICQTADKEKQLFSRGSLKSLTNRPKVDRVRLARRLPYMNRSQIHKERSSYMSTVTIKATVPSAEDQAAVKAAIASLKQKLPFLINLDPADRKSLPRSGGKVQTFIKEALDVAVQNPTVLPVAFDVNDMIGDMQLLGYLTSIQLALRQLMRQVDDTVMQVGSQAYAAARTVYASSSSHFAGPQLEVAANQLAKHFGRKSKNAKTAANGNGAPAPAPATAVPVAATSNPTPPPLS